MGGPGPVERVRLHPNLEDYLEWREEAFGEYPAILDPTGTPWSPSDPFANDEEIVAQCDLENPESCDSCQ